MFPLADDVFFDLAQTDQMWRVFFRLLVAMILGGLVGFERQQEGKAAGLRTHMLVALGSALFVLIPLESLASEHLAPGQQLDRLSRVIQGIVTGIGFLGAGTILKLGEQREIKGLTTAASIWLTAAIGVAVGTGWLWPAVIGTVLALLVLAVLHFGERWIKRRAKHRQVAASPAAHGSSPVIDDES
ncbi:MAG TPA: MgtC/SapB family protein [Gemmataceae bacterium]|jgi:putative Mg2+ transporter-C (MgtC) family protein|nr:MgtC/SapB family protein [Gemmataceae bacterium]